MSATLGGGLAEQVARLLGGGAPPGQPPGGDNGAAVADIGSAPLVVSKGRTFPVKTHYLGLPGVC